MNGKEKWDTHISAQGYDILQDFDFSFYFKT
jgi:hypothetical protein